MLGFFVMTPKRYELVDFTHPVFMEALTIVIPNPVDSLDIWSPWRAFKPAVVTTSFIVSLSRFVVLSLQL